MNMMKNVGNNMNMMPNIGNNMNIMPNIGNNMNMMNNIGNNMNMMNNIGNNMNMMNNIGNNMNMMNNINNNLNMMNNLDNNMNMMNNNNMNVQLMNLMLNNNLMMQMELNEEQRRKEEQIKKEEKRKKYFEDKIYEIDFKRIKQQNKSFNEIKNKLLKHIKDLEESIEYNNKIINDYSKYSYDADNLNNLLKLSCSIVDIYEDKLKEFKNKINDIENIYKSGIKEIKDNALNDFNKKYNTNLYDQYYIGTSNMIGFIFDEIKFKEFCLINFNKIKN